MKLDDCYLLGHIIKAHGNNGALQVFIDADDPNFYESLESVFVDLDGSLVPFFIESINVKGNKAIVRFEDVTTVEQALNFKGCSLYLSTQRLPEMPEGSFYYHDIIGYQVKDQVKGLLGVVENVYTQGLQDLVSMRYQQQEVLIPISDEIVLRADKDEKVLYVDLPEGLLEIYL
ncbi:MAG: ribosome maturation factor RimM [Cyclobacteriaceae bacterium]